MLRHVAQDLSAWPPGPRAPWPRCLRLAFSADTSARPPPVVQLPPRRLLRLTPASLSSRLGACACVCVCVSATVWSVLPFVSMPYTCLSLCALCLSLGPVCDSLSLCLVSLSGSCDSVPLRLYCPSVPPLPVSLALLPMNDPRPLAALFSGLFVWGQTVYFLTTGPGPSSAAPHPDLFLAP